MTTYRIELRFINPYIGSRNGGNKVEQECLTLAEASKWMLNKYNEFSERYATNWGVARMATERMTSGSVHAYGKGENKCIEWDSRMWSIVEEEEEAE